MLEALHARSDELTDRFKAMNTTGHMGRLRPPKDSGSGGGGKSAARKAATALALEAAKQ